MYVLYWIVLHVKWSSGRNEKQGRKQQIKLKTKKKELTNCSISERPSKKLKYNIPIYGIWENKFTQNAKFLVEFPLF